MCYLLDDENNENNSSSSEDEIEFDTQIETSNEIPNDFYIDRNSFQFITIISYYFIYMYIFLIQI